LDRSSDFVHGSLIDASLGNLPRLVTSRSIERLGEDSRLMKKIDVKISVVERAIRSFDFLIASTLRLKCFPVLVWVSVKISQDMGRPSFLQKHRGLAGKSFVKLKFGSMNNKKIEEKEEVMSRGSRDWEGGYDQEAWTN
jgi:lipopolysaccharide/colanic/teichoic acid biosynthesis glycosyltransferase